MKTIIITYNDLSEEKKDKLYNEMAAEVIAELKESLSKAEYKKITFGQVNRMVEEKLRNCTYNFILDGLML